MIDWNRVRQLRAEIGPDDFREVADLFLQEVQETLDGLEGDIDPAALQNILHFLKGSALSIGFRDFAMLCAQGERDVAQAMDIPALLAAFDAARRDFLTALPNLAVGP